MKPLRILIVDDEAPARRILRKLLERYCANVFVVAEAAALDTARQALVMHRPDLVLLDVDLAGTSGFKLVEQIDLVSVQVVFVTAYADFALDAFRVAATDYLVKPVDIDRLQATVERVRTRVPRFNEATTATDGSLLVAAGQTKRVLRYAEIVHITADGSYSTIHLQDGEALLVVRKIGQLTEELREGPFLRIHRSHLVNLNSIRALRVGEVTLEGGRVLPVSRKHAKQLKERIATHK